MAGPRARMTYKHADSSIMIGATNSACSLGLSANQPAVLFSHNKSVPAISHSQANTVNEEVSHPSP